MIDILLIARILFPATKKTSGRRLSNQVIRSDGSWQSISRIVTKSRRRFGQERRPPDLHYLVAEASLRLDPRNSENALAELNRAIAMNPRQVQALSLRGKLRLQQHHPKDAVYDLELAHSIDPASASAMYNLARAHFALGKAEEAMRFRSNRLLQARRGE